ncbi:helix-turn-helix domain-containing protein [Pelagibacterium sp. 26DY04]|uniref:helix-turn-helix domain-containing protein n=1 Tax=Pelagibacterium sp. 26DY04 TaxID=2967130 RepID=UPI0028152883|nr:helix-turn-helix transcriptional regulator [Pelagibacterium sp. 26DY04]WMT87032.1 helix-turn-helix domain-containing protein [Pelagibacterium sp. 26DY04]
MRPRITEGHKLLAHNVRRWRELRGIDTAELALVVDWPLPMIEDIEQAARFDITLNDIDQLAEALDVRVFQLLAPVRD